MRAKKLLLHGAAWFLFSVSIIYSQRELHLDIPNWLYVSMQLMLIFQSMVIFYINYLFFVPKLLMNKRKMLHFLLASLFLILLSLLMFFGIKNLYDWLKGDPIHLKENFILVSGNWMIAVVLIILSSGIRGLGLFYKDRLKKAELNKMVRKAELGALKAQMNPHFLYNAFNTIYALAETKSDRTAVSVLQLSEIMRYVTYKSSQATVSIFEELKFIQSYIQFQKLRVENPEKKIIVDIKEPKQDFMISPLILISFVENAFKHSNLLLDDVQIQIQFESYSNGFLYKVSNEISTNEITDSGIGINTLRKILEYTYPKQHELKIWSEGRIYNAELYLNLDKND